MSHRVRQSPPTFEETVFAEQNLVMYHMVRGFGSVLELRRSSVKNSRGAEQEHLAAFCLCLPPGTTGFTGTPEFYYGIAHADLGAPKISPTDIVLREMAISSLTEQRRPVEPHWYAKTLNTLPEFPL